MEDLLQSWLNEIMDQEMNDQIPTLLEGGMTEEQVAQELGLTVEEVHNRMEAHLTEGTEHQ
jgi:DNA-directed RNA polymerase specialized sigma subunit